MTVVERKEHGEGQGGPARGYSWPPFQPGHELSTTHGSYATLQLRPRAREIAGQLSDALGDDFEPRHSAAIELAAMAAARVERALGHLLELDEATIEAEFARLDDRAKGWARLVLETLRALGLTPRVEAGVVGPTTLVVVSAFGGHETVIDAEAEVVEAEVRELSATTPTPAQDLRESRSSSEAESVSTRVEGEHAS